MCKRNSSTICTHGICSLCHQRQHHERRLHREEPNISLATRICTAGAWFRFLCLSSAGAQHEATFNNQDDTTSLSSRQKHINSNYNSDQHTRISTTQQYFTYGSKYLHDVQTALTIIWATATQSNKHYDSRDEPRLTKVLGRHTRIKHNRYEPDIHLQILCIDMQVTSGTQAKVTYLPL